MIHEMHLQPTPFDRIRTGQKRFELRLFDEKRQRIAPGDEIDFTCDTAPESVLRTAVVALHRFDGFDALYQALPLAACGYTDDELATACAADMRAYYSPEEEEKYGVVAIELALLPPEGEIGCENAESPTAAANALSNDDGGTTNGGSLSLKGNGDTTACAETISKDTAVPTDGAENRVLAVNGIFESHAHYAQTKPHFDAWCAVDGGFQTVTHTRETLFDAMRALGIAGTIEPSMGFDAIPAQLALARAYPDFVHLAIGVHPLRVAGARWRDRKRLAGFLAEGGAIAVGETGLDFHRARETQHRFLQKRWFCYQIRLADRCGLPLILHIRAADEAGLRLLTHFKKKLHGGVAHCFTGDAATAERYLALGFALGIGGALLGEDERAERLCRAVAAIPLSQILLETDAPYLVPAPAEVGMTEKQRRKCRNSSLILPAVAAKVAVLKGVSVAEVEAVTTANVYRVFGIAPRP